ncbi:MAG TPA: hypothetical protein VF365_02090 [Candidatus Limnocylindria bacterium]
MRTLLRRLALPSLVAVVAACAAPAAEPGDPPMSAPASRGGDGSPPGEVSEAMVDRVIADAASGAGVDPSAVRVMSAESVTWSDGSLGCPQPDQMYTQALVPGYRVVVEIDGEELHFHAGQDGVFTFCEDPQPPIDDGTVDR